MLLKKIKLENIRSYANEEIDFPEGTILLSGNIGSGKSSILQAIDFALFGITQELTGASLLRNGENRGSVELHFAVEDKNVIIKRSLKRGTSVVQDAGHISINNARREATATELKQSILTVLNYPEELLTKSKSLIYRYTVYTPQEEMKTILQGDKDYRLDTLRKVFGIDKYKRLRENAEIIIANIKGKNKENAIMVADLEQKKTEREKLKQEVKRIKNHIDELLPKLNEYHLLIEEKKKKAEVLEKEIRDQLEKKQKKELIEISIKHKHEENKKNLLRLQELETTIALREKELQAEQQPAPNQNNLQTKEREIITKEAELRLMFNQIQERRTMKTHAEKIMVDITRLENCPVCKRKVTKEHQAVVIQEEQGKIAVYNQEMQELEKQVAEKEAVVRSEKQAIEMLKKAQQAFMLYEFKGKNLEEKKKEITRIKDTTKTILQEIEELEKEKKAEEQQTKGDLPEEGYKAIKKEIEDLQEHKKRIEIEKATHEKEQDHGEKQILTLETDIKKKEKIRDHIGYLKEVQFWLENMFMNLMVTMEKKIMLKVHADFSTFFKKWFEILVDTEAIKVSLDDEFSPIIEQNGHEINYNFLSGGEKTAAALAYRLALNQVINSIMSIIRTKELIILDEPTDGFSAEQIDRLRLILEELRTKQIIIVSHENKIESFVQHVIKIEKNNHISAVASQ